MKKSSLSKLFGTIALSLYLTPFSTNAMECGHGHGTPMLLSMRMPAGMMPKSSAQNSETIYSLVMAKDPKDREVTILDNKTFEKRYQRGAGDQRSIIYFSVATEPLTEPHDVSSYFPSLGQHATSKEMIALFKQYFKDELLPSELVRPAPIGLMEYHAQQLNLLDYNTMSGNLPDVIPYKNEELEQIKEATKKSTDTMYHHSRALFETMHQKEFGLSMCFSYQNNTKKLILTLKTINTPEDVQKMPACAERIPENANTFFDNLGSWMDVVLSEKVSEFRKEKNEQTPFGVYG